MAKQVGISQKWLQDIESGKRIPSLKLKAKFEEMFNASWDELMKPPTGNIKLTMDSVRT